MSYLAKEKGIQPYIIPEMGREITLKDDLKTFIALRKVIKRFKPDIIHTHTAKAGTLGRLVAFSLNLTKNKKERIRLIHTFHGHVFHSYFGYYKTEIYILIEMLLSGITDKIIVISEQQKNDICGKYRVVDPGKVDIIPLGFDLSKFSQKGNEAINMRRRFISEEDGDVTLVGIIGRLTAIKNHKMLLDAVRYLKVLGRIERFRFLIVGDGELREYLENYAMKLGINDYVIFTGWQKDMAAVYNSIDIVALTSLNEGTPVTLIEAMAAGIPVVSTDVGGVKDLMGAVLEKNPNGFDLAQYGILVSSGDHHAMSEALTFMAENERACIEMAEQARSFVLYNYSKERLVRDIELLYSKLVTRHS
jgi:glycosyltransferase involved in cell wall biosynthesis